MIEASKELILTYIRITEENVDSEHICCAMSGKQSITKKEWLKKRFSEGLVFYRSTERGKCFIEYIPAENAWATINADGYIYIKEEDIWNYLKEIKWKDAKGLSLYDMTSDILNTDNIIIDNYLKEKLNLRNRNVYFDN